MVHIISSMASPADVVAIDQQRQVLFLFAGKSWKYNPPVRAVHRMSYQIKVESGLK